MRLPVAAKIALHSAGVKGGTPGSPTPLDGTSIVAGMMCTCVISRRLVDARDLEAVEIVLLRAPVLEADLAVFGEAQRHHRRPLDLRADALGVGGKAAIDRGFDARHR